MVKDIGLRIFYELIQNHEGLTNKEILKLLNDNSVTRQLVDYHLKQLLNEKLIIKFGTKNIFNKNTNTV